MTQNNNLIKAIKFGRVDLFEKYATPEEAYNDYAANRSAFPTLIVTQIFYDEGTIWAIYDNPNNVPIDDGDPDFDLGDYPKIDIGMPDIVSTSSVPLPGIIPYAGDITESSAAVTLSFTVPSGSHVVAGANFTVDLRNHSSATRIIGKTLVIKTPTGEEYQATIDSEKKAVFVPSRNIEGPLKITGSINLIDTSVFTIGNIGTADRIDVSQFGEIEIENVKYYSKIITGTTSFATRVWATASVEGNAFGYESTKKDIDETGAWFVTLHINKAQVDAAIAAGRDASVVVSVRNEANTVVKKTITVIDDSKSTLVIDGILNGVTTSDILRVGEPIVVTVNAYDMKDTTQKFSVTISGNKNIVKSSTLDIDANDNTKGVKVFLFTVAELAELTAGTLVVTAKADGNARYNTVTSRVVYNPRLVPEVIINSVEPANDTASVITKSTGMKVTGSIVNFTGRDALTVKITAGAIRTYEISTTTANNDATITYDALGNWSIEITPEQLSAFTSGNMTIEVSSTGYTNAFRTTTLYDVDSNALRIDLTGFNKTYFAKPEVITIVGSFENFSQGKVHDDMTMVMENADGTYSQKAAGYNRLEETTSKRRQVGYFSDIPEVAGKYYITASSPSVPNSSRLEITINANPNAQSKIAITNISPSNGSRIFQVGEAPVITIQQTQRSEFVGAEMKVTLTDSAKVVVEKTLFADFYSIPAFSNKDVVVEFTEEEVKTLQAGDVSVKVEYFADSNTAVANGTFHYNAATPQYIDIDTFNGGVASSDGSFAQLGESIIVTGKLQGRDYTENTVIMLRANAAGKDAVDIRGVLGKPTDSYVPFTITVDSSVVDSFGTTRMDMIIRAYRETPTFSIDNRVASKYVSMTIYYKSNSDKLTISAQDDYVYSLDKEWPFEIKADNGARLGDYRISIEKPDGSFVYNKDLSTGAAGEYSATYTIPKDEVAKLGIQGVYKVHILIDNSSLVAPKVESQISTATVSTLTKVSLDVDAATSYAQTAYRGQTFSISGKLKSDTLTAEKVKEIVADIQELSAVVTMANSEYSFRVKGTLYADATFAITFLSTSYSPGGSNKAAYGLSGFVPGELKLTFDAVLKSGTIYDLTLNSPTDTITLEQPTDRAYYKEYSNLEIVDMPYDNGAAGKGLKWTAEIVVPDGYTLSNPYKDNPSVIMAAHSIKTDIELGAGYVYYSGVPVSAISDDMTKVTYTIRLPENFLTDSSVYLGWSEEYLRFFSRPDGGTLTQEVLGAPIQKVDITAL